MGKQKGPQDLSRSPTQATYIKTGTVFYKKNLAKSNTQTSHWYQHVPKTENIINAYNYIRNSWKTSTSHQHYKIIN